MPLTVWSSARYTFPLPDGHRFPVAKYALLREAVIAEGIVPPERVLDPSRAEVEALELVHSADYVRRFTEGSLDAAELRRLGFPWSEALVERSYRAVGGTIAAARHALAHGIAMNLAGGTHHAFPDHGEGFCVFNDVAVAIRLLLHEGLVRRAAVVDLDVHQGNGTASIFRDDPSVFTLSLHGQKNFPFRKEASDLDVELPDGCGDADYLTALEHALDELDRRFSPGLVIYLAGADPFERDRLGRLKLSFDGLEARDRRVFDWAWQRRIPMAFAMAGGYASDIAETVQVQLGTFRVAFDYWRRWQNAAR